MFPNLSEVAQSEDGGPGLGAQPSLVQKQDR